VTKLREAANMSGGPTLAARELSVGPYFAIFRISRISRILVAVLDCLAGP
jgi:hypothetical protein